MTKPCKFLLMAAGTGGHVFPALAVAKALLEKGHHVEWLGTPVGMEQGIVRDNNIALHAIDMKGFRGKSLAKKLLMPLVLLKSLMQALTIMLQVKPDVVVGFGGYITLPGGLASKLLLKKLVIHEQNSVAGSANKLLAKIANTVLVAYPNVLANAQYVGNPVRQSICALHGEAKKKQAKNILIMGGSLGAQAINEIMPSVITSLQEQCDIAVWHQTGKDKLAATQHLYGEVSNNIKVEEFVQNVEAAYRWADIIICRAGALTVSELTIVGLPAIFIPLPHAIDNHQYVNAKWLVDQQAAILIEQKELTHERLVKELLALINDQDKLNAISNKLKVIAKVEATNNVVNFCESYCSGVEHHAA